MTWPWQRKVEVIEVKTLDRQAAFACLAVGIGCGIWLAALIIYAHRMDTR